MDFSFPCRPSGFFAALALIFLSLAVAVRADLTFTYNAATDVPVTASGYTASGTAEFTLNFAPMAGTNLTVVKNTAPGFISGQFSNLPNGATVNLTYNGTTYSFVAWYYGGNGNDLVLLWPHTGLAAWGQNSDGQLGDNTTTQRNAPVAVNQNGVLADKTIVQVVRGSAHTLVLTSEGKVYAWGDTLYSQIGDNTTTQRTTPVAVNTASGTSALFGKIVVSIAAGDSHSLALCSDGTVVAWGNNSFGQLGDNTTTLRRAPVAVNTASGTSALFGKTVTAIAAGGSHNLALCSDGTVVAWGCGGSGQLGDNTRTNQSVPVVVNTSSGISALFGKVVTSISAGDSHSLALCSDGTVVAWGYNYFGQLGDNTTTQRSAPVAVNRSSERSVLFDKVVTSIVAGGFHSLALCSDGTIAAWGSNNFGQLGDNTTTQRSAPVAVNTANGVSSLFGKAVTAIAVGFYHTVAICSDGTVTAWGNNSYGQLGDNTTTQRRAPVAVNTANGISELFGRVANGLSIGARGLHGLAIYAKAPPEIEVEVLEPTVTALANNASTVDYGMVVGALRTFRVRNTSESTLAGVAVSLIGPDASAFVILDSPATMVSPGTTATFRVALLPGSGGTKNATLQIASNDGDESCFEIELSGTPATTLAATFNSASDIPLTTHVLHGEGSTLDLTLNFAPAAGTNLTVVKNMGAGFIITPFSNVANGAAVNLTFNGTTYPFIAWYYGGDGNDLVLLWRYTGLGAWGRNAEGQLGDNTTTQRNVPADVDQSGVLVGKTIVQVVRGSGHTLALTTEGKVYAWGLNSSGQLGDNTTVQRNTPVAVNTTNGTSSLFGKTVVAVAAGSSHSLALCSDGTVAAWGYNSSGQLGDNTTTQRKVPAAVNTASGTSALFGKTVMNIAAGESHSMALCSDGTVAAWGYNYFGQLGDNTSTQRNAPVSVNTASGTSALFSKTVTAISAGYLSNLALCSDGTIVAWGRNAEGQLGDTTTTQRNAPVAVNTASGTSALFGKTVVTVSSNGYHNLALCSDGTVATWGSNNFGQLGDNASTQCNAPVTVNTASGTSALFGKTVTSIAGGLFHSIALFSDGTVATWGSNSFGQLGDNTITQRNAPVVVNTASETSVLSNHMVSGLSLSSQAFHSLVLYGRIPPQIEMEVLEPTATALADNTSTVAFGATLAGTRTFRVHNVGESELLGVAASLTGPDASDFTILSQPTATIAPGATSTFQVTFLPGSTGTKNATLQIASDDRVGNSFDVALSGAKTTTLTAAFNSSNDIPLTLPTLNGNGSTLDLTLNFAPAAGTNLTVARIVGPGFILGPFSNVSNGATVNLTYHGKTYSFIAWYYGGDGNDLMLLWPHTGLAAWGSNGAGQLGDNTTTNRKAPMAANLNGVLAGKTIVQVVRGGYHTLVLTSEGKVYSWGFNFYGQLGDNTTTFRSVPVEVNSESGTSALFEKTVVAIAAGEVHSLALCSDGTVTVWGNNSYGQLGDNTTTQRNAPVVVNTASETSALFGKTVVAIAGGGSHSLALCSDGTAAAWGYNGSGQLGDNTTIQRNAPVEVNAASGISALFAKTVTSIVAGGTHSLALCSDGTIAAWGNNGLGQLGDNTLIRRNAPVKVSAASGISALFAKTAISIVAGETHSLALCSDGMLAAWGDNGLGQLGDNTTIYRTAPVAVNTTSGTSALFGKTVVTIAGGLDHNLALCSDGTVAAWGDNRSNQLGDNTSIQRNAPMAVTTASGTSVLSGRTVSALSVGSQANHSLAIYGIAAPPTVTGILPLTGVTAGGTTVTITGANFTGATAVTIGGTSATGVTVVDDATIQAITPAHGAGLADVVVTTPSGSATGTGLYRFGDVPTVSTPTNIDIAGTTATLGGNVTSDGGDTVTERGVVYSVTATNGNPTIGGTGVTKVATSGTTGVFAVPVSGLTPGTAYTFAAYATNSLGTAYSSNGAFDTTLTALQSWRLQWYGTPDNAGEAADGQDPYHTGVPNLLVLAFFGPNQDPALVQASQMPAAELSGGNLTCSFTEPAGGTGLTYGAEWSATLEPGSWLPIPDTGSDGTHLFSISIGSNAKIFMRLTVEP